MDPKTYGEWTRDYDSSWSMMDPSDGTLLRVSQVLDGCEWRWVLAWTEQTEGRVRIGLQVHSTAEAAMDHANATVVLPRRKIPRAEAAE